MNKVVMKLNMFGGDKDFFTQAFEEAYTVPETLVEDVPTDDTPTEDVPVEDVPVEKTPEQPIVEEKPQLSKEEIKQMYEEYYGEPSNEPEIDEDTQTALELYRYLESNPHLIQAMREVDVEGYSNLNNYVPDEITKRLAELEEFVQEQNYNNYIKDLKSKFNDFDEDKVLKYAEERDIVDLEVAYKALKADSVQEPDMDAIREQIKKELLEELKNNSIKTQSIVGTHSAKPLTSNDVKLSGKQERIARAMGMTASEYAKWS